MPPRVLLLEPGTPIIASDSQPRTDPAPLTRFRHVSPPDRLPTSLSLDIHRHVSEMGPTFHVIVDVAAMSSSTSDHLKMEMEMEIPSVKASANSDIIFFFTSAQDGNKLLDDERLSLADDLKKAHDQNQNKSK
ncbi:hypothetical protein Tco_0909647 [Tanacetum coccineum]|uniref:Uncharacterized protein n=1 Tax=Tanacetum coccineum TaxID=301880 RepID=A0ABQ5CTD9_9ASTR